MLKELKSEDFHVIKDVANDRLSPDGISAWFIATLISSVIMFIVSGYWLTGISRYLCIAIFVSHILATIFYFNLKHSFKYQKIQVILLLFTATKLSVEFYLPFYTNREINGITDSMTDAATICMVGGLVFLLICNIRAARRAKEGHFREGGKGLYDWANSKKNLGFVFIYPIVMLFTGIIKVLLNNGMKNMTMIFLLCLAIGLQYLLALVLPEFYLLAYCKFKYDDFIIDMPESLKKKKKLIDYILYFPNRLKGKIESKKKIKLLKEQENINRVRRQKEKITKEKNRKKIRNASKKSKS